MKIVLSGINITSGGMLSVYKDCLNELIDTYGQHEIIALVSKKELFLEFEKNIDIMEFPLAKKSWWLRCYYEYIYFYFLSNKLNSDIWISMHDMTPNVKTNVQCVYCHNSTPFFKMRRDEIFIDWKITMFSLFYKYLYKINIHKNKYIIVQQEWLREKFKCLYNINNIIVASPTTKYDRLDSACEETYSFIYPTFPRMFKNIEVIGEALKILCLEDVNVTVYITIDGSENRYSRNIVRKYKDVPGMKFIGLQSRTCIMDYYNKVDGLIFPSRLETWGMPLSEFRTSGKKIIAADLPYAKESLSNYTNAKFFPVDDPKRLADILKDYVKNDVYHPDPVFITKHEQPYAKNWRELFNILINNN